MPIVEPVGSGKEITHWNCSGCTFWSKDQTAVAQHIVEEHGASGADAPAALASLTKPQLVAIAAERGIDLESLGKRPTNAELVAAIEEDMRLAEEAAAALAAAAGASSSGEGDQGGTNVPADDPGASTPGEAGAPPSE